MINVSFQFGAELNHEEAGIRKEKEAKTIFTDTRPYSGALNHNDADVVRKFGEIKRAPFNCFVNLSCALMLDGAKSVFEI